MNSSYNLRSTKRFNPILLFYSPSSSPPPKKIKSTRKSNYSKNQFQTNIDDLPFELFRQIFIGLDVKTRLKMRRVSKLWMNKLDNIKINNLMIMRNEIEFPALYDKIIPSNLKQNQLFVQSVQQLNAWFTNYGYQLMFRDVKFFAIIELKSYDGFILSKILNAFNQLERLVIKNSEFNDMLLCLPNLNHFYVDSSEFSKLYLIAQKLTDVYINFDSSFNVDLDFVHPESLINIKFDRYNRCLENVRMCNVEYLYCKVINQTLPIDFLKKFTQLKEIHFDYQASHFDALHHQKELYNLNDLKIYYLGLCLEKLNQYGECFRQYSPNQTLKSNLIKLYYTNQSKLAEDLSFHYSINYTDLEKNKLNSLPIEFWNRFKGLKFLFIKEVQDELAFFDFLNNFKKSKTIFKLTFEANNNLQRLFNRLPYHAEFITHFDLFRSINQAVQILSNRNHKIKFNFLLKMKNLINLRIDLNIDLSFLADVFNNLNLKYFSFYHANYHFKITWLTPNKFHLHRDSNRSGRCLNFTFYSFNQLVNCVEQSAIDSESSDSESGGLFSELDDVYSDDVMNTSMEDSEIDSDSNNSNDSDDFDNDEWD